MSWSSSSIWPLTGALLEFRLRAGPLVVLPCLSGGFCLPRYLLKTPDKWLNSAQGSNAKRKIQEALAAKLAAGELTGFEHVREEDNGTEGGLLAEESQEKERQAS